MFLVVDSISESGFPIPRFMFSDSVEVFMMGLVGPFSVLECFRGGGMLSREVEDSLDSVGLRNLS